MSNYKTGLVITGDASGGIRAVRATETELGKLNKGFERGTKKSRDYSRQTRDTSSALNFLRQNLAPISTLVAGIFSVNALRNQIDFADQLQKTNLRIGAGTAALSEYNYVAELSGVQFNTLTTAWQRQTRRISEAASGTGEASKALQELNLNARELTGLSPEQQFERIAQALGGVENPGRRAALAMRLWDTEGVALLQMVNQGSEAITRMREEAQRLGLTITQDTANQMADFNDELTKLRYAATGLSRTLLVELMPSLSSTVSDINDLIQSAGGVDQLFGVVTTGAELLAAVIAGRLAAAFYAAAAAKVSSIAAMRTYTVMTASGLPVVHQMTAAQVALTAASTAASRALLLMGGPIGAAVIAAGAVYAFREELGLARRQVGMAKDEIAALQNSVQDMSEAMINNRIDHLSASLDEAILKAALAREEIAKLERESSGSGVLGFGSGEITSQVKGLQAVAEAQARIRDIELQRNILREELERRSRPGVSTEFDPSSISNANTERLRASAADYLRELHRLNSSEQQQILHWRSDNLARIRDFHRQQVISAQDAAWAEVAIEEEASRRLSEIREKQAAEAAGFMANIRGFSDGGQSQNDIWYQQQLHSLREFHRESLISEQEYNEASYLLSQEWESRRSEILEKLREQNMSTSERFIEQMRKDAENFDRIWTDTFNNFASGFASTVADTLLEANTLQQGVGSLLQGFARSMIQTFAEIAIKRMALWVMEKALGQSAQNAYVGSIAGQATAALNLAAANAYASTAAIPIVGPGMAPAAALAASAAVSPFTIAAISAATSASLAGMAHDGINNIPKTGTWLLEKGERVVDSRTNSDLKQFLERHTSGSASSVTKPTVTITVPLNVQAQPGMSEQQARMQGRVMADQIEMQILSVMQEQMRPGGLLSKD